jgi:hypothetical protein
MTMITNSSSVPELANSLAREAEALLAATGLAAEAADRLHEFGRLIVERDR